MTNLQENWLPITNYEGLYEVSNFGNIRSNTRTVKIGINYRTIQGQDIITAINKGYAQVILCKNSKHKTFKIHRLVATHFIPNSENKPEVNHKDGIKLNNHVSNLEWSTRSENNKHAFAMGLKPMTEKRLQANKNNIRKAWGNNTCGKKVIDIQTGEVFDSIKSAAKHIGRDVTNLRAKLRGRKPNNTNLRYYTNSEEHDQTHPFSQCG